MIHDSYSLVGVIENAAGKLQSRTMNGKQYLVKVISLISFQCRETWSLRVESYTRRAKEKQVALMTMLADVKALHDVCSEGFVNKA